MTRVTPLILLKLKTDVAEVAGCPRRPKDALSQPHLNIDSGWWALGGLGTRDSPQ